MSIRHPHAPIGAAFSALALCFATAGVAGAQSEDGAVAPEVDDAPAAESAEPAPAEEMSADGEAKEEAIAAEDDAVADALDQGVSEQAGKQYLFLGARYRAVVIPTFVQSLFADGGEGLVAHSPGLEFAMRKDGFEYNLFTQLGFYTASDVPFKGKSDEATAWEIIDFDYSILTLGADFMWSTDEFAPGLSMTYGAGLGLGIVFGSLTRTQAHPKPGGNVGKPEDYVRCLGVGNPDGAFCNDNDDHYNGYEEPSWSDGGSSPLVFPWIAGQIGLRYKIHRNFVSRLELGVMPTGGFIGIGADYGL